MSSEINKERLFQRIMAMAEIVNPDEPPYSRRCFTDTFLAGRQWLEEQFRSAGLTVSTDAGANLIGRLPGTEAGLPSIMIGSHTDTVRGGGRFDGIAGVLSGLEVAQALQENKVALRHPLEVVDFLGEEPNDYGSSCVGSRAMVGQLSRTLLSSTNAEGETLGAAIDRMGGDSRRLLQGPLRQHGSIRAFLELHIEQGPLLETRNIPIGIVTDIVGIQRYRITVSGQADHAGTTPMELRKDALVGASWIIQTAHEWAKERAKHGEFLVATVGKLVVHPNAPNVVPERVDLVLEARSSSPSKLSGFMDDLLKQAHQTLVSMGLKTQHQLLVSSSPTRCSPIVVDTLIRACQRLGVDYLLMSSGAGHDAMFLATIAPTGMIFVPCREGRSHSPDEWAEPDHLAIGARVLCEAVRLLDADDKE